MVKKGILLIGVIIVTAVITSAAVGYAAYNGNTYSENNTMPAATDRMEILIYDGVNYSLLDETITLPEYRERAEVSTRNYILATSGPGTVYVRCDMGDAAAWALIDSMDIHFSAPVTIESENVTELPFGKIGTATGVPTSAIPMNDGAQITVGGVTYYTHEFHIDITFADYDDTDDPNFERLSTFAGSKIMFTFVPETV